MPSARKKLVRENTGLREELALANRRFNAWWEGFEFSEEHERARLRREMGFGLNSQGEATTIIAASLWGDGRIDPGTPAWMMRHARVLGLPLKADVALLGSGTGAPVKDLRSGTKWKIEAYSHHPSSIRGAKTISYQKAASRLHRGTVDGGICLFDLHRERDPAALALFAAELAKPNAPFAFVDFTSNRRGLRLGGCFSDPLPGTPQSARQYADILKTAGFRAIEATDESKVFVPLVADGWAKWRDAYRLSSALATTEERARYLNSFSKIAHIWAERFDALRAGHLQVTRFLCRKG